MVTPRFVSTLALVAALAASAGAQQVELLDFYLPTCGPCQAMAPVIARLEQEGVRVRRVDGSREPQLAAQLRVQSYPTFVATAGGRETARIVGATSYEEMRRLIDSATQPQAKAFAPTAGRQSTFAQVGGDWGAGQTPPTAAPAPTANDPAAARLLARSVRLTVVDDTGRSYGTGTIVDARSGEALVVTCAHLFRGPDGQPIDATGRLTVELFDASTGVARVVERSAGQLVSHDFDADVALVAISPSGAVETAPVAASPADVRVGLPVRSVGCDHGADPTVRESRVVDLNRYQGPPNIEASGAPVQGRSGGGLFDAAGRLVGVCNFADDQANEGIYAGLASIHAQLDKIGMASLYRGGGSPAPIANGDTLASTQTPPLPPAPGRELAPVERTPVVRGQNAFAPSAPAPLDTLTPTEQATLGEIVSRGERAEVVVLIRPDQPGGRTEVVTLDSASPEFVATLKRLGQTP